MRQRSSASLIKGMNIIFLMQPVHIHGVDGFVCLFVCLFLLVPSQTWLCLAIGLISQALIQPAAIAGNLQENTMFELLLIVRHYWK